jgi:hypothetical protein
MSKPKHDSLRTTHESKPKKHKAKPNKICKNNFHNIKNNDNKHLLWNLKSPKVI